VKGLKMKRHRNQRHEIRREIESLRATKENLENRVKAMEIYLFEFKKLVLDKCGLEIAHDPQTFYLRHQYE